MHSPTEPPAKSTSDNATAVARRKPTLLRRTFIVDREFQIGLLVKAACYSFAMLLILCAGVFRPIMREVDAGDEDAAVAMLYMHQHFWPVAILCTVLAMLVSIQLSHRIAGPLYRMKAILGSLRNGVLENPVSTRKYDYLKREVAIVNDTVHAIATATDEIKAAERELALALADCEELVRDSGQDSLCQAVSAVQATTAKLRCKIDYFRRADVCSVTSAQRTTPEPACPVTN